MAGKFELTKTENGHYQFNLIDSDGRLLFTSEAYPHKSGAQDGIVLLRERVAHFICFERKKTSTNKLYYVIREAGGQVIGSSRRYSSIPSLESNISAIRKCVSDAAVVDATEISTSGPS